jgi:hypothetical protein
METWQVDMKQPCFCLKLIHLFDWQMLELMNFAFPHSHSSMKLRLKSKIK